jgi:hypothetical protein
MHQHSGHKIDHPQTRPNWAQRISSGPPKTVWARNHFPSCPHFQQPTGEEAFWPEVTTPNRGPLPRHLRGWLCPWGCSSRRPRSPRQPPKEERAALIGADNMLGGHHHGGAFVEFRGKLQLEVSRGGATWLLPHRRWRVLAAWRSRVSTTDACLCTY